MLVRLLWPLVSLAVPAGGVLAAPSAPYRAPHDTVTEMDRAELMATAQSLLNAVASGDTATWSRYLLPDCVLTDADGVMRTKAEVLASMHPLPPGYSGTIRMQRPFLRVRGATAIVAYAAVQHETVYGQHLTIQYRTTDTYLKTPAGWRLLASQSFVIPREPSPVPVDSATLGAYVGKYALDSSVVYEVVQRGNRLFGRWPGGGEEELIPAGAATFFRRGVRGVRRFERDASGLVTRMVDQRDGNDLVWTRVP